ncbi:N4-gp56 family major capsid protein [Ciceribacter sp. L1K22]|uniref:N4-gp56 family major capsid protein n=1 Tax=Ciceribacter sp. L1K22 TaxID=2820275 RepID=UPI001ABDF34E|nr:N4-gp56 family major capsid protein [Ciceribacter sp. L1K22]MBO3760341.1 N4-gp56 family major capsid protein [Ciceribacter sp. L1K22]
MAPTTIPFGDPKAVKKWSGNLFIATMKKSYWDRKFIGDSDEFVIQRLTDLESDAGDTIQFDLSVQLRSKPTYGDNRLQGKEEALRFYSDEVKIDQMRHGVSAGGKMSRKRTIHNIRKIGRDRLSDYWSKFMDQMVTIYMAGSRGVNENFYEDIGWAGHANNPIQAPDAAHLLYGGDATSKATLDSGDKMNAALIRRAKVKAGMMAAVAPENAQMLPVMINGEAHYICVMSEFQSYDMKSADAAGWLEYQKAAAGAEGRNSPLFKGNLGMIDNVVLHDHQDMIRFSDYGAGGNVKAARALFMGRQAGVIAFGATGGYRFSWTEEMQDHGNEPVISAGIIAGAKKTRFNNTDFGNLSLDTAAADPNAAA